jgi:hypothetical protein
LREPELEHRLGDLQPRLMLAFGRIGERDHQAELTRVLAMRAADSMVKPSTSRTQTAARPSPPSESRSTTSTSP